MGKKTSTKKSNRLTMSALAKLAGVSRTTVSVIVREEMGLPITRGEMRFSEETRQKVKKLIEQTGFRPNSLGRSLVSGKSFMLGLLIDSISRSFMAEFIEAIEDEAEKVGYGIFLMTSRVDIRRRNRAMNMMVEKQVDGLILCNSAHEGLDPDHEKIIHEQNIPVVNLGRLPKYPIRNSYSVRVDGTMAGKFAISHLQELGHKKVAFVGFEGAVKQGIDQNKNPDTSVETWSFNINIDPQSAMDEIFTRYINTSETQKPTGLIFRSDELACTFMHIALRNGLPIPEDISLVGTDDLPQATEAMIPLTTIRQPRYEQGTCAAKLIFDLINNKEAEDMILQPELVVRQSTSKPKNFNA